MSEDPLLYALHYRSLFFLFCFFAASSEFQFLKSEHDQDPDMHRP